MIKETQRPIVSVRDLTVGYNGIPVLRDLNFVVERGEILVILGGSGCGKSTLLKHMIGLLDPIEGDVIIDKENISRLNGAAKRKVMQKFGVLYQSGALFGSLTVSENIMLPLEEFSTLNRAEREILAEKKLALVGLEGKGGLMPSELSGGMRKRAGLARAMALDPPLLFFDEPSAGLDPISSAALDRLILNLRKELGTTMIIVSHELPSVFAIADRVILLNQESQGIIASGAPLELLAKDHDPRVQDFLTRSGTDIRPIHPHQETLP